MARLSRSRTRRLVPGVLMVVLAWPASGAGPLSGRAWEACRERVLAAGESAGRRDYGDAGAYAGATGVGALAAVIEQCGYRGGRIDRAFCDDLYEQVYPACREDGFEGLSMAAASWVAILDPRGPVVARLRRACEQPAALDRAGFARRVCGD